MYVFVRFLSIVMMYAGWLSFHGPLLTSHPFSRSNETRRDLLVFSGGIFCFCFVFDNLRHSKKVVVDTNIVLPRALASRLMMKWRFYIVDDCCM